MASFGPHRNRQIMYVARRLWAARFLLTAKNEKPLLANQPWHYAHWLSDIKPTRRTRIRMGWFALGLASGMAVAGAATWLAISDISFSPWQESEEVTDIAEGPAQEELEAEAPVWPRDVQLAVSQGDQLLDILMDQGIASDAAYDVVATLKPTFDPRSLKTGHALRLVLDADKARQDADAALLQHLTISLSKVEEVNLWRNDRGSYDVQKLQKPVTMKTDWGGSPIKGSLYLSAKARGVPDGTIVEMIRAFSYDVDFQRDIKEGDSFETLYEKFVTAEGDFADDGNLLYASLKTKGRTFKIFRFVDSGGVARFFNEKGESIVKKLLRTPIDGARITSGFGMRRHPLLGYSKMHKGVDFGAPSGTPIFAAGDGVVEFAGRRGAYGNLVLLKHHTGYSTAYAHASRIASGMRKGRKVRQGQVVAYVGSTGRSTGAHLHYEIRKNGLQVNPANVKFAGGERLSGRSLARFKETRRKYETSLAQLKGTPTEMAANAPANLIPPPLLASPAASPGRPAP